MDVWLFANDYNLDMDHSVKDSGFPMLLMQLAHILLLNKVWEKKAGLRIFLIVPISWDDERKNKFENIIRDLRLRVQAVVPLQERTLPKVCLFLLSF